MGDAPLIVGVSGLRGIVGQSLTPEVAVRYGRALAWWLGRDREGPFRVALGRDGRAGGEMFEHAVASALLASGVDVVRTGPVTTPTMAVVVDGGSGDTFDAGVMVTASHNPQRWNGLKLIGGAEDGACAPKASDAAALVEAFESGRSLASGTVGFEAELDGAFLDHARAVWTSVVTHEGGDFTGRTIVVDSVNCAGADGADMLWGGSGARLIQLCGDGSGVFPHTPEPTAENLSGEGGLCDAVPGLRADVGFAQDPDADRLAIVDENGRYIGEEYTLVIAAEALLHAHEATGASTKPVIVVNLSTSRMIEDVAARWGAEVVRTPVGEANVVERMKKLMGEGREVLLGGEGNGGVIWPEVCFVRDSLGAMALTLSHMARSGLTVSGLVERIDSYSEGGKGYCIVKRKTEIASKADAKPACDAVEKAYASERVDTQDGVRVDFSGARAGCWVHVRASNTEPIMRLIGEAPTEALAGEILDEVAGIIARGAG